MCKRNFCLTVLFASFCIAIVSCEEMDGDVGYSADHEISNRAGKLSRCATAKERGKIVLACPAGQTIDSIVFASYGTPVGTCVNGFKIGSCHGTSSQEKVTKMCRDKQFCTVDATNGVFGDPCVGTYKRLYVEYTCSGDGGEDGGDGKGSCVEASEGNSTTLKCSDGQKITNIEFASYGLPKGSCAIGYSKGLCHASSSQSKVRFLCQGKQSCKVGANNGTFGDPCKGTRKKLAIVYSCNGDGGDDDDGGGGDDDEEEEDDDGGGGETSDDCWKNGISRSKQPGSNITFTDMFNWSKHLVNNRYDIHVVATEQISNNQMRKACEGLSHMVHGIKTAYRPYLKGLTVMIHADPHDGVSTGAATSWFIIDQKAFCSTTIPTTGSVTPNSWKTFVHEAAHTIAARIPGCDFANENYFPYPSWEQWAWRSEDWFGVSSSETRNSLSSNDYNHLKRWYDTSVKWDAPNYCNFND